MKNNHFNMFLPMLCIFTLLSYTYLEHPTLIEATQTRTKNGFTLDLIHRYYSPISPSYNNSMSSKELFYRVLLSSASRYQEILSQQQETEQLQTNLIPNEGDYLVKLTVGTPSIDLFAVLVTNSDLTWFQCLPCTLCYTQNTTFFDPQISSTYNTLGCDAQLCNSLDSTHIKCDQNNDLCRYWYSYGNGTSLTEGVMGSDSFYFTPNDDGTRQLDFTSILFGCGYQQNEQFDMNSAGVLGLGNGPISLVSQLGSSIDYKFSYCLPFFDSNQATKLRFGSNLYQNSPGEILTVPLLASTSAPNFYYLGLNGISIGKTRMSLNREISIDTGTSLTYVNPSIFYNLEAMVSSAIGANPVSNDPSVDGLLCYDTVTTAVLSLPDITFHLIGGDLVFKSRNIFVSYDTYVCLSIVMSSNDGDPMVIGNMAQINFEIEFDLLSQTVSFAPADCSY
ncbi:unnamed protein product [Amaranthus hypochondriacus]